VQLEKDNSHVSHLQHLVPVGLDVRVLESGVKTRTTVIATAGAVTVSHFSSKFFCPAGMCRTLQLKSLKGALQVQSNAKKKEGQYHALSLHPRTQSHFNPQLLHQRAPEKTPAQSTSHAHRLEIMHASGMLDLQTLGKPRVPRQQHYAYCRLCALNTYRHEGLHDKQIQVPVQEQHRTSMLSCCCRSQRIHRPWQGLRTKNAGHMGSVVSQRSAQASTKASTRLNVPALPLMDMLFGWCAACT
jgi:hypothetical protein